jgi:primosomal protein N' (replication factor Y)
MRELPEKPGFTTKPISAVASDIALPPQTIPLIEWLTSYYPAPLGSITRQFLPPVTSFPKKNAVKKAVPKNPASDRPQLTTQQEHALASIEDPGSYLLHGITGSGKTRIYIELAQKTLQKGRSVIILTPEIGLTEHIAEQCRSLPYRSVVLHSRLTNARRRDLWYEILESKEPVIVIGPRSALFTPTHNIGLIIIDEAHDQAYKNDAYPHYRTDRIAAVLANLHQALFVMGTATPNIEDYYTFITKKRPIIKLDSLAVSEKKQVIHRVVDMKDTTNFSRSRIISHPLLVALEEAFTKQEQVLLFLNRRGTASAILCNSCGWRAMCPHCDLPLTYHADIHSLLCHTCGRKSMAPSSCPECNNVDIVLKSIGTKAVVEEIERLFPTAKIQRFDTDVDKAEHIEQHLSKLRDGTIDVIVGTQMITKGLDLPKLSVVGIINADSSLLMPDYSAAERTYQLVGQVVGRVGRGHRAGSIILQTYSPENPTLLDALKQDYDNFYKRELAERQAYHFPPFCFMARLTCLRATSESAEKAANKLKTDLEGIYPRLIIEGPSPAFHSRESGKYKWQLVIKSSSRQQLTHIVNELPSGWHHDLDPINLL